MPEVIDDELAIRNLIARLAHVHDAGTLEEYEGLLHADTRWILPNAEPASGREAILAGVAERRASGISGPGSDSFHMITSVAVDVDGEHATATSYWLYVNTAKTPPAPRAAGVYADAFRKVDGRWYFVERVCTRS